MIRPEELTDMPASLEQSIDSEIRRAHSMNEWPAKVRVYAYGKTSRLAAMRAYAEAGWRMEIVVDDTSDYFSINRPASER